MTNNRALLTTSCRLTLLAVLALGLAPAAQAQGEPDKTAAAPEPTAVAPEPGAAAAKPGDVQGVTVVAPTPRSAFDNIPAEKKAALAAEAANNEAWRKYRESTPRLTRDPNDQSKDFPGLQTYVPK